jgi:hypothetical protein
MAAESLMVVLVVMALHECEALTALSQARTMPILAFDIGHTNGDNLTTRSILVFQISTLMVVHFVVN